jgi:hypothetical protein
MVRPGGSALTLRRAAKFSERFGLGVAVRRMVWRNWPSVLAYLSTEPDAFLRLCITVMAGLAEREEWTVEEGCCLAVLVNVVADGGWGYMSALVAPCAERVGC